MKKYLVIFLLIALSAVNTLAQNINLNTLCVFPSPIAESSGLIALDNDRVLTHNDSGDSARLFIYNHTTCTMEKQVVIRNYHARDMESITLDDSGFVYMADMGNNLGNRTNLCILKMPLTEILSLDTVEAQKILFSYFDQHSFSSATHNFDAEGFFHHHDSLFIFSKNHGVAGNYCKRYGIPDVPGTYMPAPLDSISLPTWVTDAAISPSHKHFVLASEQQLYVFYIKNGFAGFNHFMSQHSFIPGLTQKEGICFVHADSILVSDELAFGLGGKIYTAEIGDYLKIQPGKNQFDINVYHDQHEIVFTNPLNEVFVYEVYNLNGLLLERGEVTPYETFRYFLGTKKGLIRLISSSFQKIVKF